LRLGTSVPEERLIKPVRRKVLAYITNRDRLLVFRQPDFPNAGIQVPGGTIGRGETPAAAALREAVEETGLRTLELARFLGSHYSDHTPVGKYEVHLRHVYHLICAGDPPDSWHHLETDPSEGPHAEILFEFWWAPIPNDVPPLIMGRDALLPALYRSLGLDG
jgi:8-oxo-dGTP pyrophosphatase MutT (NUDIX family)